MDGFGVRGFGWGYALFLEVSLLPFPFFEAAEQSGYLTPRSWGPGAHPLPFLASMRQPALSLLLAPPGTVTEGGSEGDVVESKPRRTSSWHLASALLLGPTEPLSGPVKVTGEPDHGHQDDGSLRTGASTPSCFFSPSVAFLVL